MVLRSVARLEAEHGARMRQVAIAPPVVGDDEEDVESERRRRGDAELEQPDDVPLAAPDRIVARREGAVLSLDPADAHADRGQPVRVGVVAGGPPPPPLSGAPQPRPAPRPLAGP